MRQFDGPSPFSRETPASQIETANQAQTPVNTLETSVFAVQVLACSLLFIRLSAGEVFNGGTKMNSLTMSANFLEHKPVRIAAIGLVIALLSACGSNETTRSNSLFSTGGPSTATTLISGGDAQAQCTNFDSLSVRLGGKATTYYYNGVLQEDKARVRITSLTDQFDSNANYYIQAFRWRVNSAGATEIDNTAVQFQFENGAGSDVPISTLATSISTKGIATIRAAKGMTGTGAIDFFAKTTMVVNGVDYSWQALKIVVYDGSTTPATVVGQSDFLLPVFQANPNRYAATHNATLTALHPFLAQSSQNLSESEWGTRTLSFCF